jgi:hypothetical protein
MSIFCGRTYTRKSFRASGMSLYRHKWKRAYGRKTKPVIWFSKPRAPRVTRPENDFAALDPGVER